MCRKVQATGFAAVALMLAGCGNDQDSTNFVDIARTAISQSLEKATAAGTDKGAQPQAIADPAAVLAQVNGPVIFALARDGAEPFYLIGVRDNGPYRTYATGTRQTMTLRQGIVTATRGAGDDLMSSDIKETLALLQSGSGGQARRLMQFLDGEDRTIDLVLDCTITAGLSAPGNAILAALPGRKMTEDCASGTISFRNSYHLDASGRVTASVQWLSSTTGSVVFQELRP
ncbi:MAG: YjbF family lipoprotein [Rhodobacterales bacterium]